jgi:hypothetical protein
MEARVDADRGDDRGGVGGDREAFDAAVPRVRLREDRAALGAREAEGVCRAARGSERESEDCDGGDAGSHGLRIGSAMAVSDPARQVPEDLLPTMSLFWKCARVCERTVPKV